jgi:hypothetical protein
MGVKMVKISKNKWKLLRKEISFTDYRKSANSEPLNDKTRALLLELNYTLYNLTFEALDAFWRKNVRYPDPKLCKKGVRHHPMVEHLKDDPYWNQLHNIEKYLYDEHTILSNKIRQRTEEPCVGCENIITKKYGKSLAYRIKKTSCENSVNSGKCMLINITREDF